MWTLFLQQISKLAMDVWDKASCLWGLKSASLNLMHCLLKWLHRNICRGQRKLSLLLRARPPSRAHKQDCPIVQGEAYVLFVSWCFASGQLWPVLSVGSCLVFTPELCFSRLILLFYKLQVNSAFYKFLFLVRLQDMVIGWHLCN